MRKGNKKGLFELEKNNFIEQNKCTYIDQDGNRAFMKREKDCIIAKLRFANIKVKADAMHIKFPLEKDKEGDNIRLHYEDEKFLQEESVKNAIENFTLLINYWISMLYDINYLEANPAIIQAANPNASIEEISKDKLLRISQYQEIAGLLKAI